MARGKYKEIAVNKNIHELQNTLDSVRKELADTKDRLNKASRRLRDFESLEDVFKNRTDILRENEQLEARAKKLSDENNALRSKLLHYAEVMNSPSNSELRFSQEMLADFAEMGLLDDVFNKNRSHRRIVKTAKTLNRQRSLVKQLKDVTAAQGYTWTEGE